MKIFSLWWCQIDQDPNSCPVCNHLVSPNRTEIFKEINTENSNWSRYLEGLYECPSLKCGHLFLAHFERKSKSKGAIDGYFTYTHSTPKNVSTELGLHELAYNLKIMMPIWGMEGFTLIPQLRKYLIASYIAVDRTHQIDLRILRHLYEFKLNVLVRELWCSLPAMRAFFRLFCDVRLQCNFITKNIHNRLDF